MSQNRMSASVLSVFICAMIFRGAYGVRVNLRHALTTAESSLVNEFAKSESSSISNSTQKFDTSTQLLAEEAGRKTYRLGATIKDWDKQRQDWLEQNPHLRFTAKGRPRMTLVTSSPSEACPSSLGDHYLLKSIKNKIDYTRLHNIEIYYNMVVMEKEMTDFWIKLPLVRKLMLTHPEAEWIWWMDSDAMFTNMAFEIPLEKYDGYNMIVHGWGSEIYEKKNWVGLNAGIFLVRNCQWTLDLLDMWAELGENHGDNRDEMGKLFADTLTGRPNFASDDQSALVYLLSTTKTEELKPKVFLENTYDLHGYWVWAMERLEGLLNLREVRDPANDDWSFITHFVGCKTCSGSYASYALDKCLADMERAFNLADNQVLNMYGFEHVDLTSPSVKRIRNDEVRVLDFLDKSPVDFLRRNPWRGRSSE